MFLCTAQVVFVHISVNIRMCVCMCLCVFVCVCDAHINIASWSKLRHAALPDNISSHLKVQIQKANNHSFLINI